MTSRERVIAVIRGEKPDRVPIYGWVRANLEPQITQAFGSVEAFEDNYEFDFAHLFGGPGPYAWAKLAEVQKEMGGAIDPIKALDLPPGDPNDMDAYASIKADIDHHKTQRERFVYVQTPGIFEMLNAVFGIENHLLYLLMYPDELQEVYRRQADWNIAFANNCIDLGIDMVHVSDDWGSQRGLMFSTPTWWDMIYPHHKRMAEAVKARGAFLSLHSDGNVNDVVDGIIDIGYDVVHPWQESAGMSLDDYKANYQGTFAVMGGLDVQNSIGFGDLPKLEREIERVMRMFKDGGLLFCTTHFVQDHCSMTELTFAFDTAYRLARE